MKKLIGYYNFIVVSLVVFAGFADLRSSSQLAASALFYPLFVYFALLVVPATSKAQKLSRQSSPSPLRKPEEPDTDISSSPTSSEPLVATRVDPDRRAFLKIIGSAGLTVFFYALFSNKAEAAFFGSVPGPGIIGLKDAAGTRIDPAVKQPTDGYRITELDDGVTYVYGGYVDKDGNWFISREELSSGSYRYVRGSSNFSTNWTNRASLTYDYFNNVF